MTVNQLIKLELSLKMMLVIGIQNGFEGCVVEKIIKNGGNGVAKKTI